MFCSYTAQATRLAQSIEDLQSFELNSDAVKHRNKLGLGCLRDETLLSFSSTVAAQCLWLTKAQEAQPFCERPETLKLDEAKSCVQHRQHSLAV